MHATSGANLCRQLFLVIGPSKVHATSGANLGMPLFLVLPSSAYAQVQLEAELALILLNPATPPHRPTPGKVYLSANLHPIFPQLGR